METGLKDRVLFITRALPVESGGTMIVVRRLLDNLDPDKVIVLGRTPYKPWVLKNDNPLPYRHMEIPTPQVKGFRIWRLLSVIPGFFQGIYLIYKYRVKTIIGVYPDEGSLILAAVLSFVTRKSLMVYFCDLYMENRKHRFEKWLSRRVQPWIFKRSIRICAVNGGMKDFYDRTYGVDCLLLPTAINGNLPKTFELPAKEKPFIIGYSGSIVRDRLDPMQALVKAIGNNPDFEIRLFTPQKEEYLESVGLLASNVKVKFCSSHPELLSELRMCHALYLPLTFKTDFNSIEQLATCFGIKSYEYFQSCRPVLVHCPPDYYTSTYFTSNKAGVSIDSLDNENIIASLKYFVKQYAEVAPEYVDNALRAAVQFDGRVVATRLCNAINNRGIFQ